MAKRKYQDATGSSSKLGRAAARSQSGSDYFGRLGSRGGVRRGTIKTTQYDRGVGRVERTGARTVKASTTESERDGQIRRKIERQNREAYRQQQAKKRRR